MPCLSASVISDAATHTEVYYWLHCALSLAAQCIVIGPVCEFVCMCGSVTTITRKCMHRSSPNWVCR